jgi:U3 small nucleolar ribonucleoprotein protein IMP4
MKQLLDACRANSVTDFIVVHEHLGQPNAIIISHLPYGPTAYFNVSDVVMRHDIPDIGPMSEQYPHLVFHNMKTLLGQRVMNILKYETTFDLLLTVLVKDYTCEIHRYLFPVSKEDSKRVITFANHNDFISYRHHTTKKARQEIKALN